MWRLRELRRSIQKLYYWFHIIWKDRDWDHDYIFEILKHKLKSQSKYLETQDSHLRVQQDVRRIKLCISLIAKVQDETYKMEYQDYLEDEIRFEDYKDKEGFKEIHIDTISENLEDYFKKYPLIYKRVLNGEGMFSREGREDDKEIIALNIAHINQNRAHKLLFKTLEENILGWWD